MDSVIVTVSLDCPTKNRNLLPLIILSLNIPECGELFVGTGIKIPV